MSERGKSRPFARTTTGDMMPNVNEQLERLWGNNLPEGVNQNAEALKRGLVAMEQERGVSEAGVHQVDNSLSTVE